MDRQEIERLVERGWPQVRVVSVGLAASVALHVAIAWLVVALVIRDPLLDLPIAAAAAAVALGLLLILCGYLAGRAIRAGGGARNGATGVAPAGQAAAATAGVEAAWKRYVRAELVAAALREAAAVVGLVLTVLTGELAWVVGLAAATLVSMTVHWPRRDGAVDWLLQQRTTG